MHNLKWNIPPQPINVKAEEVFVVLKVKKCPFWKNKFLMVSEQKVFFIETETLWKDLLQMKNATKNCNNTLWFAVIWLVSNIHKKMCTSDQTFTNKMISEYILSVEF